MIELYLPLIVSIIFSYCSLRLAHKKGRNPWLWAVLGLLFGFWCLIVLYFLPKKYQKKIYKKKTKKQAFLSNEEKLFFTTPYNYKTFWYYLDDEENIQGSVSFYRLKDLWVAKKIKPSTFVWHEKMKDWKRIKDLMILKKSLPTRLSNSGNITLRS